MKIENSTIKFSSQYINLKNHSKEESLRILPNNNKSGSNEKIPENRSNSIDKLSLSNKVKKTEENEDLLPPELRMIKLYIEKLTGKKINIRHINTETDNARISTNKPITEPQSNFIIEYEYKELLHESEKLYISTKGVIKTTDGQTIEFTLSVNLNREFIKKQNIKLIIGNSVVNDPLIINFNGDSVKLKDTKFYFDIDSDGQDEQIPFFESNSGFLAFDRNEDGIINNGKELFGPETGDGFSELSRYDLDQNKWIDENDPIFDKLAIWSKDLSGENKLESIRQKGIGAIYLGTEIAQFQFKNKQNETLGKLRASGIYTKENGSIDTIQQIDLVT